MVEREDINASIEMGLAQLMLELHHQDDASKEMKGLLSQILARLESIEAKLDQKKD